MKCLHGLSLNFPRHCAHLAALVVAASLYFLSLSVLAQISADQPAKLVRWIVELEDPPLVHYQGEIDGLPATAIRSTGDKRIDVASTASRQYLAYLEQVQQEFVGRMGRSVDGVRAATFLDEHGEHRSASYRILVNALTVEVADADAQVVRKQLLQQPGVKAVHPDKKYFPDLYASLDLINAPSAWSLVGGRAEAGQGIKVASMDQGVHHAAPMFDGSGWNYPPGYPLGDTANTNGKIIVSRLYVRADDPPVIDDSDSWPGAGGGSHGVHTASTAVGNIVDNAVFAGTNVGTLSGVAPGAWVMNYRVFYTSVTGEVTFATAEGLAALEDIVADGADVVNNSWGSGPNSVGAPFNLLDQALINAAEAGVFVVMSSGNAGPFEGSGDHPGDAYVNVAASTSGGSYSFGRLHVSAPQPVPVALENMAMALASFGTEPAIGTLISYSLLTAASVDLANVTGCNPWPADTFADSAAVISRGGCEFSTKVLHAEQAGASFVIIYNNSGDGLINMGAGAAGDQVTISSIFIGQTNGNALVDWYDNHGDEAMVEVDMLAYFTGNQPDVIANFSSRGPSAAGTLKPDIAAPGVAIMAQGYAPGAPGEAVHLGYGQANGTSMAAPHVAGAAAVLRELYPNWSNQAIKSALMSTAKFMEIYNQDGTPAQPLDMGAGRLDLERAVEPGVILDPPSLSFGYMVAGSSRPIEIEVTSVADTPETYTLSTLYTGAGFDPGDLTDVPGLNISPSEITLLPGESATLTITFDSAAAGVDIGDNQGFVLLTGDNGHQAHLPAWARVAPEPKATADILLLQNDMNGLLARPNYLPFYTSALDDLGLDYDVYTNLDWWNSSSDATQRAIPHPAVLSTYKAIIYFSGDHFQPNGTFAVPTPLTRRDMDRLTEYVNTGGILIATGQDATLVMNNHFLQRLSGAARLQDSINDFTLPDQPVLPAPQAPPAFADISLDLTGSKWVNFNLSGTNEVPPVATTASGTVSLRYRPVSGVLSYEILVQVTNDTTITAAHIHQGGPGVNGPVLFDLSPPGAPVNVTDQLAWDGAVVLDSAQHDLLMAGELYVNVHTSVHPSGEVRANLLMSPQQWSGDGAANQLFVDELAALQMPLFYYPSAIEPADSSIVAVARRNQPSLENPGIDFLGRMVFLGFGLEGVNDGLPGQTSRSELLSVLLDWAMDEPEADIIHTQGNGNYMMYQADVSSNIAGTTGISYRWDYGDGSPFVGPVETNQTGHYYEMCGVYTVRVEATDSWGNVAIGSSQVPVTQGCVTIDEVFRDRFEVSNE
jgi:subtilisin family serine protease